MSGIYSVEEIRRERERLARLNGEVWAAATQLSPGEHTTLSWRVSGWEQEGLPDRILVDGAVVEASGSGDGGVGHHVLRVENDVWPSAGNETDPRNGAPRPPVTVRRNLAAVVIREERPAGDPSLVCTNVTYPMTELHRELDAILTTNLEKSTEVTALGYGFCVRYHLVLPVGFDIGVANWPDPYLDIDVTIRLGWSEAGPTCRVQTTGVVPHVEVPDTLLPDAFEDWRWVLEWIAEQFEHELANIDVAGLSDVVCLRSRGVVEALAQQVPPTFRPTSVSVRRPGIVLWACQRRVIFDPSVASAPPRRDE